MKHYITLLFAMLCVGCGESGESQLSNDEYDRLYMANKEFTICDANMDGVISLSDIESIKNNASRRECQALLDSRDSKEITKAEYLEQYKVPEIIINGERKANIVYKTVGDQRIMFDLYLPYEEVRPEGDLPVVIFFHGGGWRNGDKYKVNSNGAATVVDELLKRGVAVAAANYRFVVDGEVFVPTVVSDAKDVVAFIHRDGKRYGLDGERIIVWGGSAGGHLSLMCGFTDEQSFPGDRKLSRWRVRPTGVVSWYGSGDFTLGSWEDALARGHEAFYRCFTTSKDTDVLRAKGFESSPLEYVSSDASPTVLFGGDADTTVSIKDAIQIFAKLQRCGVESDLIVVKGAGHGWSGKNFTPTKAEIDVLTYNAVLKLLNIH